MELEEAMLKITELTEQVREKDILLNSLNEEKTNLTSTIETLNTDLEKSRQDTKFYFDKVLNQFDKSFGRETPTDVIVEKEPEIKSKDEALQSIVDLF